MSYYDLKQDHEKTSSLATEVAKALGGEIVSRNFHSGDLIDDEIALSQQYDVSRSVIRDAVKILVGKGLLEVRRGVGTRVNPRHKWGLFDDDVLAWSQIAPPDYDQLQKLLEVRLIFEPKAARWAAERGSATALSAIKTALSDMEKYPSLSDDFVMADAQFHSSILRATDNEFLIGLEGLIFTALLTTIRITNTALEDGGVSVPQHAAVYNAIENRDGRAAEEAMEELLRDARRKLEHRLHEFGSLQSNEFDSGNAGNEKVGAA